MYNIFKSYIKNGAVISIPLLVDKNGESVNFEFKVEIAERLEENRLHVFLESSVPGFEFMDVKDGVLYTVGDSKIVFEIGDEEDTILVIFCP